MWTSLRAAGGRGELDLERRVIACASPVGRSTTSDFSLRAAATTAFL
jgi:hypothetical protein